MKNSKIKNLLTLFLTFFKVGAFTFGGGYGMIALLEAELVGKKSWIDEDPSRSTRRLISAVKSPGLRARRLRRWQYVCRRFL